jgi:hypothetical protein
MPVIYLEAGGKSARVEFQSLPFAKPPPAAVVRTAAGPVRSVRASSGLNTALDKAALTAATLVADDPELDIASVGETFESDDLTTAYYDPEAADPRPIGDFQEIDVLYNATGQEKERRAHVNRRSNLNEMHPVKAGKRLPMATALTQFVFRQAYQLLHTDSLTYEFLFGLAKELHEKQEFIVLGAGPKGNLPLIMREKGSPYRAFLSGEIGSGAEADRYRLLLLLSDMELKQPEAVTKE